MTLSGNPPPAGAGELSPADREVIRQGIEGKYAQVAQGPAGHFAYPTGRPGLEGQGYSPELLAFLPPTVAGSYCGVGNPFALGPVEPGEEVLDVGCGAGVDTILAAHMAGPAGRAVGLDLSPDMLAAAQANARAVGLANVGFQRAGADDLPFPDASFDLVISNGVFNLTADKARALAEVFRVLKPGGRLQIADQVARGPVEKSLKERVATWFQ
ncbi:MAG: methyltransferase domain-containing protein [Deltaproteobacteria bacterium]|nr:methyltransferase domain-containing protein [Deltaproteobacteria bacterium]